MKTVALIPLNSWSASKSRLRGVLYAPERAALARWMAGRVLDAVRDSHAVTAVAVISPGKDVIAWAQMHDVTALRQDQGGLNEGLEQGRRWAVEQGAEALLVLLGDLPHLNPREVASFVAMLPAVPDGPSLVIAPDRRERGTNGLLLRPPSGMPFAFGDDSLARHKENALRLGLTPVLFESNGTSRDIDTPADVRGLLTGGHWSPGQPADVAVPVTRGRARL